MEARAKIEITEWIVREALAGTNELEIVAGLSERLTAAGVSLVRCSVATNLLDPTFDGRGVRWNRGQGVVEEAFPRTDAPEPSEQTIIVSWAFAEAAGEARSLLVGLGRYAMKGIARPQELFTLDPG